MYRRKNFKNNVFGNLFVFSAVLYYEKKIFFKKSKVVKKLKKEDNEIIEMLFSRDQQALSYTEEKYGALCRKLAFGILGDYDYAAECMNTSLYKLWKSVPPAKPQSLKAYLCKIVRSVAFSMRKKNSPAELHLTELSELLPDDRSVDDELDNAVLTELLNEFLSKQKEINRRVFILRYYYNLSIDEIAEATGEKSPTVKTKLYRMREELKKILLKKGFNIQKG